ncbi:MAG: patatin-like phospholipase family protein [Candidatus Buchananbacteria bacterium]
MADNSKKKIVGLAISGGWIRAASAIGAVEVLLENGIEIDMVSGCSAGSVVASAFAAGNLDKLKLRFLRGKLRDYLQVMFQPTLPRDGFLKSEKTIEFWREFVGDKSFSDLDKKLFLNATDLNTLSPVVLCEGKIAPAIQACVNIPGMFVAFKHEDKILADGGNFNLIPSKILYDNGADYVIALDVSKGPNLVTRIIAGIKRIFGVNSGADKFKSVKASRYPNIFVLVWRALRVSSSQIHNFFSESYQFDILIRPEIDGVKRWQIKKVDFLIKRGREASLKQIVKIKHDLGIWQ